VSFGRFVRFDVNLSTYGDSSSSVVLDNLVLGVLRASTLDQRITSAEHGNSVLADIAEPDILDRAGSEAVNTLEGVHTDNNVGESGTVLKDEDGVVAASVGISVAGLATVELLVAKIDAALDDRRRRESNNVADASRDVERLR